MKKKWVAMWLVASLGVLLMASMASAQILICLGKETHQGEVTVAQCAKEGHRFVFIDLNGVARILTKEELDLTMAFNPKIATMKSFSKQYASQAEKITPLPPRLEP